MSLGGMITRLAALKYPARVASRTAIGSSPFGEDNPNLPGDSLAWNGRTVIQTPMMLSFPGSVERNRLSVPRKAVVKKCLFLSLGADVSRWYYYTQTKYHFHYSYWPDIEGQLSIIYWRIDMSLLAMLLFAGTMALFLWATMRVRHVPPLFGARREAAFALRYAAKETDIIPDFVPEIGYADDSLIVRTVLSRHQDVFHDYCRFRKIRWENSIFAP
jgi:uncharacterized membrane protein YkvA (DUF1232 family)